MYVRKLGFSHKEHIKEKIIERRYSIPQHDKENCCQIELSALCLHILYLLRKSSLLHFSCFLHKRSSLLIIQNISKLTLCEVITGTYQKRNFAHKVRVAVTYWTHDCRVLSSTLTCGSASSCAHNV